MDELKIEYMPLWLLLINKNKLQKRIKQQNPLAGQIELKPIISFNSSSLKIIIKEYIPWARFSNGWLLAFLPNSSATQIIPNTPNLSFDNLSFASEVLLVVNSPENYAFWNKEAKNIQKLIYLIASSFPEKHLKTIYLEPEIKLYFEDGLEVELGKWDEHLLKRANHLISLQNVLKKYKIKSIDLKGESRARLKEENIKGK